MKKIFLIIFVALISVIPFNVNAQDVTIKGISISGPNEATVGEETLFNFLVEFSGLEKNNMYGKGIVTVEYDMVFNNEHLSAARITKHSLDTIVYKDNGYKVLGFVSDSMFGDVCANGVLYCGNYLYTLSFYILETDLESVDIEIKNVRVQLLDVSEDLDKEYTEDDVIEITSPISYKHTIKVKQREDNKVVEAPKQDIIQDSKPEVNDVPVINIQPPQNNPGENNAQKSNNKYLKSLKIENYELNFDKNKNRYEITISSDVNSLKVTAQTENSKATYRVRGADNLKENNYIVLVEVIAENGDKNTYTIHANIEDKETVIDDDTEEIDKTKKNKWNFKFTKKHFIIAGITGGSLLLLIIIIRIIIHRNDRKLEKALDEL